MLPEPVSDLTNLETLCLIRFKGHSSFISIACKQNSPISKLPPQQTTHFLGTNGYLYRLRSIARLLHGQHCFNELLAAPIPDLHRTRPLQTLSLPRLQLGQIWNSGMRYC